MNYSDCLKYLAGLGQELHGLKFGTEAISLILEELGRPQRRYDTAIVAGTNGKGSTCAMLASILQFAGCRTGLFTSPHLVRVNERMKVNGHEIPNAQFAAAFTEVAATVESLVRRGDLEKPPSFFEFLTATAFQHFATAEVDFAVLEVGMGGRLDATNVTVPSVAVITNIDFDHMEFLGSTLGAIATEKAGIIKPLRPVISGVEEAEAAAAIRRRARECGAELTELKDVARVTHVQAHEGRYSFDLAVGEERFTALACPLLGRFQIKNTVAAVAAACRLRAEGFEISHDNIVQGVQAAQWPGRLETIHTHPLVLLDGGHNPGAAVELAAFLRDEFAGRRIRLVYASMRDKAMREITATIFPLAEEIYLTQPEHARAATPEEILAAVGSRPANVQIEVAPARALAKAFRASAANDVVLVVGSLYLVGTIKKALEERRLRL
jgi:dihydrofolate synthase/folylpolyglutamate synthase